jgi:hypothetical protein
MKVSYSFEELVTTYHITQRKISEDNALRMFYYPFFYFPVLSLLCSRGVFQHKFLHISYFFTIFYMSRPTHPFRTYVLKILYEN